MIPVNIFSKKIGGLIAKGQIDEVEEIKAEVNTLKESLQPLQSSLSEKERELYEHLVKLPNLPHESVPEGKTPEENEIVREGGNKPHLFEGAVPHWDLAKKYDLINFELGNKVTGAGFPFYKNNTLELFRDGFV